MKNMSELNDLSNKKVGDRVFDALGGEWKVVNECDPEGDDFCLKVQKHDLEFWVALNGAIEEIDAPPMFFSEPVRVIPAQGECDFSGYQVGDLVYFADGTSDVVTSVCDRFISAGKYLNMPLNGKDMTGKQIFFHAPPNIAPSNPDAFRIPAHIAERKKAVDWANVPIDTLVEVRLADGCWYKKYFAGITDGKPAFWMFGATSLTAVNGLSVADEIRLANEENTK